MNMKLSASLMCADFLRLEEQLRELEEAGVDYLHMDIMDGSFVPNLSLGFDFVTQVKRATALPLDVHLMIWQPERYIATLAELGAGIISVHVEATTHICAAIKKIKDLGVSAGVALNPGTHLSAIEYVLDQVDMVLVMTVNPGFAGQQLVPATLRKVASLRRMVQSGGLNIDIEVDGNVSFENARKMAAAGANVFVGGTSSIFAGSGPTRESVDYLRKVVNGIGVR